MSRVDYYEYLKSEEWDRKRKLRLKSARYRCELCGSAEPLQVHHLHYDNLGSELIDDLMALCNDCHEAQHTHPNHWQVKNAAMLGLLVKRRATDNDK